ncbi:hypothetical protein Misp02_08460 [Microtetraspora sp. NBRC 16547]|nr:hypothetical protein Misp02_08460 [Microtetraspora sp. NBRC 16547]
MTEFEAATCRRDAAGMQVDPPTVDGERVYLRIRARPGGRAYLRITVIRGGRPTGGRVRRRRRH